MSIYSGLNKVIPANIEKVFVGNNLIYKKITIPTASLVPTVGVTYSTDLSLITPDELKLISMSISNNNEITNTTTVVYINNSITGNYKLSCELNNYSIKTFNIDNADYEFVILGFNHDTLTNENYYGKITKTKKAGITWQSKDMVSSGKMNNSNTTVGGWTSCIMRTTNMVNLLNNFNFKDVVATVNKYTSSGNGSSVINIDSDKFFLLSEIEIANTTSLSVAGEGTQYSWFKAGNSPAKNPLSALIFLWWSRSPNGSERFVCVEQSGAIGWTKASNNFGIALAFCS